MQPCKDTPKKGKESCILEGTGEKKKGEKEKKIEVLSKCVHKAYTAHKLSLALAFMKNHVAEQRLSRMPAEESS